MSYHQDVVELLTRPGNQTCADCGLPDPVSASYTIGVFLCSQCAAVHRKLGSHISNVKALNEDDWTTRQLDKLTRLGNLKAKQIFERFVPLCYRRPTFMDHSVLQEQWIRAKYEREEFIHPDRQVYTTGQFDVILWKRGKEDPKFHPRKFSLSEVDDTIKYYVKESNKEPKATIRISEANATFVPQKIGNPNGLQLSYVKDGSTRHLFVYAEDGKDIVDWYLAMRSAKLNRLHVAFPAACELELSKRLTRDFVKEGWLSKTGPRDGDGFKRRWFTLDDRKLMYMEDPLAAYARGEIFLGNMADGYLVVPGVAPGAPLYGRENCPDGANFTLRTPNRVYSLRAETLMERDDWISVIDSILQRPLTPQDNMLAATLRKRSSHSRSSFLNVLKSR